jgi:hypothetical protein
MGIGQWLLTLGGSVHGFAEFYAVLFWTLTAASLGFLAIVSTRRRQIPVRRRVE